MSTTNGKLDLTGDGSAYVRVSDDQQDTLRQYESIHAFERSNGIKIPESGWFKDEGWARDTADRRPEFQRLMKLAEDGRIKWIVVSERDRFGTTDADEFMHYRYLLRKWGVKLYDANGTEWTKKDIATVITSVVDGEKSEQEQHSISRRVMGGMVGKAKNGEYQGGAVRLGLDIGCFDRATSKELWRIVLEARDKRVKVFPDGRTERFDGKGNFPKHQDAVEMLRLTPSRDRAKVEAAISVFERYAAESISFTALAHYVNSLGMVSCYGQPFESRSVQDMLADPIYLGYATWNKLHQGKFHRHKEGRAVLELNYGRKQTRNHQGDWIQSTRLFDPLVTLSTWNVVQEKIGNRTRRAKAPHSHRHYLAGLMVCGNCGQKMIAGHGNRGGNGRYEYQCGEYTTAIRYKRKSTCLRNGAYQDVMEKFLDLYLQALDKRLEILTSDSDADHLTDRLSDKEGAAWTVFKGGIERLLDYLIQHHPDQYRALMQADHDRHAEAESVLRDSKPAPPGLLAEELDRHPEALKGLKDKSYPLDDFAADAVDLYRSAFDPAVAEEELRKCRAEYDRLVDGWADLPTKRAKDTAKAKLATLEARLEDLERQQTSAADVVVKAWQEMRTLQAAIAEARIAMHCGDGERSVRRKAEAIRKVVQRIECTFAATGKKGKGASKLVKVTIYPLVGDAVALDAGDVISCESGSPPPKDTALTPCAAQSVTNDTNSSAVQRVSPSGRLWL